MKNKAGEGLKRHRGEELLFWFFGEATLEWKPEQSEGLLQSPTLGDCQHLYQLKRYYTSLLRNINQRDDLYLFPSCAVNSKKSSHSPLLLQQCIIMMIDSQRVANPKHTSHECVLHRDACSLVLKHPNSQKAKCLHIFGRLSYAWVFMPNRTCIAIPWRKKKKFYLDQRKNKTKSHNEAHGSLF